jgi:hypothetical protein
LKRIPLTQGYEALVDDEDYEWLCESSWSATLKRGVPYACGRRKGKFVYMHRLIIDAPSALDVDHINHNSIDNRRCNLRLATRSQNNMNGLKRNNGRVSRFKGACRDRGKWRAYIGLNGRIKWLGFYGTEEEAALAYNRAAIEYFGEFARLNEIPVIEKGDHLAPSI